MFVGRPFVRRRFHLHQCPVRGPAAGSCPPAGELVAGQEPGVPEAVSAFVALEGGPFDMLAPVFQGFV